MLICLKCNHDNELGRIFCHQCGTKLDISQIKPPIRGGKSLRAKGKTNVGRIFSWGIRLVILGLLGWGIYLFAQVPEVKKIKTANSDLVSFYQKRDRFEVATKSQQPATVAFTQAEINAAISTMDMQKSAGRGVQVSPTALQILLAEDSVTVVYLGKIAVGSSWEKQLYLSYTGVPSIADGKFVFQPQAAQLGKLPVPRLLLERTGFMKGYFRQLFGNLKEEQHLIESASSVKSDTQLVTLRYERAAPIP